MGKNIVNSTALLTSCVMSQVADAGKHSKREIASQTVLTFPPILPKEVEELLKNYHYIDNNDADLKEFDSTTDSNRSMMDISTLRRKLFINRPESPCCSSLEFLGVNLSPAPQTPELTLSCQAMNSATRRDSFSCDMFGELSPIQACSSPMISNDISMTSDFGHETPSRRNFGRKTLQKKGKNLSESFCLLQNDFFDEASSENQVVEAIKEFPQNSFSVIHSESVPLRFGRFDSGFPADDDSKLSAEFMQF